MQLMKLFHHTVLSVKSLTVTQSPETAFYTFLGTVRLPDDCQRGGALFLNPPNTLTLNLFRPSTGMVSVQKTLRTAATHSLWLIVLNIVSISSIFPLPNCPSRIFFRIIPNDAKKSLRLLGPGTRKYIYDRYKVRKCYQNSNSAKTKQNNQPLL